jgi:malonate-semialdehyde dehydrogenase (acetylating)/methylmalonate-semialdehyde dehydrogenase
MILLARGLSLTAAVDAHGDILRGLQVVESACSLPTSIMGSKLEGRPSVRPPVDHLLTRLQSARTWTPTRGSCPWAFAPGVLCARRHSPLLIRFSVAPFNFPAMIPCWASRCAL